MDNPIQKWAKHLNRYFTKEDMQMAKEHMKRYSALLVIREIQIKTILRRHFTPTRIAIIQKSDECWWGWGETGTLSHCWWECNMAQLVWKMLNMELSWDPELPLLGIYPREMNTHVHTKTILMLIYNHSCIYTSQKLQATQMCIKWWMDK